MIEKIKDQISSDGFTYTFVKIGLVAFAGITLYKAGEYVGGVLKMMSY